MLTDQQYAFLKPYFPPKRRPGLSYREFLDAVLFVLETGCQWRKLPKEYGNWHTIYTRFKRWSEQGIMQRVIGSLLERRVIDCSLVMIDSTVVRAHHCASGAQKKKATKVSGDQKADSQRRFMRCLLMKQQL